MRRSFVTYRTTRVLATLLLAAACSNGPNQPGTPTGHAVQLIRRSQNPTSAPVGSEVTLSVVAVNALGAGVARVPVNFAPISATSGMGTVLDPSLDVLTNAQGIASVRYIMPTNLYASGGVVATSLGLANLQVDITAVPGPPAEIRVTLAGTGSTVAGADIGQLSFSVVDANGHAIPLFPVTFAVTSGGGSVDGLTERTVLTADRPATTTTGPTWRSGPSPGANTLMISTPSAQNLPTATLTRTTVSP